MQKYCVWSTLPCFVMTVPLPLVELRSTSFVYKHSRAKNFGLCERLVKNCGWGLISSLNRGKLIFELLIALNKCKVLHLSMSLYKYIYIFQLPRREDLRRCNTWGRNLEVHPVEIRQIATGYPGDPRSSSADIMPQFHPLFSGMHYAS